ncbi:hypothetical protein R1sor_001559 [Riccia sorocarpa]|uniref:CW-type domain-containing protein n=1 Tax=Riccia sorocarpa TaxID=122646 RepID=A0ABD3GWA3_9MARC
MRKEGNRSKASFDGVARQPGRGRGRYHILTPLPSSSKQKLRQSDSGNSDVTIVPLFEKVLSASDVHNGRMILPRTCAEAYFPAISGSMLIEIVDVFGKIWAPKFSFWRNKEARIYFLQGLKTCIHSMELQVGDTVTFSRLDPVKKFLIGPRSGGFSSEVVPDAIGLSLIPCVLYLPLLRKNQIHPVSGDNALLQLIAKQRWSDTVGTAEVSLSEGEDAKQRESDTEGSLSEGEEAKQPESDTEGSLSEGEEAMQREYDADETEREDSREHPLGKTSNRCHSEDEGSVDHTIGVASKRLHPENEDSLDRITGEMTKRRRSESEDNLELTLGRTAKRSRAEKEDPVRPTIGKKAKRRHSENQQSVEHTVSDIAKRCRLENEDSVQRALGVASKRVHAEDEDSGDRLIGQKSKRCRSENEFTLELTLGRTAKRRRAEKDECLRPTIGNTAKQQSHSDNEDSGERTVSENAESCPEDEDSVERALGQKSGKHRPDKEDSVERVLGKTAERSRTPSEDVETMERAPTETAERWRTQNEDSKEMDSWKEAQELLRPPPLVVPTVVTIEGHDFEAYAMPPVLTKPTVFTLRQSGENDQWAECDECGNWRKVPADAVVPSRWTCRDNSWDKTRASCSVPQERNSDEIIFR